MRFDGARDQELAHKSLIGEPRPDHHDLSHGDPFRPSPHPAHDPGSKKMRDIH